jgi:hypothetical protein
VLILNVETKGRMVVKEGLESPTRGFSCRKVTTKSIILPFCRSNLKSVAKR